MTKKLAEGMRAPQFEAVDVFGKKVKLSDNKDRYTLVVFLRYAGCPWCNLALHRLAMEQQLLKDSRCDIVAFIQSSEENIQTNIYDRHKHRPEFPIIPDQAEEFYKLYDVRTSVKALVKSIRKIPYWIHAVKDLGFKQGKVDGNLLMVPAMFLVGEGQQNILYASYSSDFYQDETFTEIYQKLLFD
jgi:peroxiredoxin Q/BCP